MGFLYSKESTNGRKEIKILGGLIKKIKTSEKKEAFVLGIRVYRKIKQSKKTLYERNINSPKEITKLISQIENKISNKDIFIKGNRGLPMNKEAINARDDFNESVNKKEYKLENLSCLCNAKNNDLILATQDRYGIDLNTVICKNCGLLRSNPYYTNETLEYFYTNQYRSLYSAGFDLETFFEDQVNSGSRIASHVDIKELSNKTVYEIGCGAGGILQYFKKQGAIVKGVDHGKEYIKYGISKGLELEIGSVEKLTKHPKADIVILNHVLEHIIDAIKFLNDIKQIIKENGVLYIAVPTIETIPIWYQNNIYRYLQNAHVWNFSNQNLAQTVELAGYKLLTLNNNYGYCICTPSEEVEKFNFKNYYAENLINLFDYENEFLKRAEKSND